MKKNLKKLSLVFLVATSLVLTTGCGKKGEKLASNMVDKYSAYCTLGEYKGVEYNEMKTEITEADVQYQVDMLLDAYASSEEVTTGVANDGDTVNIDFVGTLDGVEFDGGSYAGWELELGSGQMIPGFEEQIVGHSVGERFDINVTFPENYGEASLAGQEAIFTITINSKVEKTYPEYNDAFVAANTDYDTVAAYEEFILTTLTENAASTDEDYNKTAIVTAVINAATVNEYPQKEMQQLIDDTVAQVESEAISYNYSLNDFVVAYYGFESSDAFKQEVSNLVKDFFTEKIVMCAIAKAENITVNDKEIADFKAEMMESMGITDEKVFAETYTDEDVAYYALSEKVVDFLVENATPVQATATDAQ